MSRELLIQCPDGQMKTVPLTGGRLSIGRSSAAELCFPEDAGLSRQHFAFEPEGDDWTVQDLGSKNGTFVNNIPLKARLILKPGDRVTAGHLVIVYSPDAADPNAGVVVFEGDTSSPTTSTVVTSLEGALSNQTMAIERGGPKASAPMQALIRAGQELSDNRPLHELFPVILDLAIQAVNAQRGVLMILEGDELVPRAHKGDGFRISTAVRDRVIKERSSILVRDAQLDDAFKGRMSIVEQKVHTMMAAPLQTKDRIIGLIYLDSPFILREFTKDDLSLLTVMANIAAIRIENARLAEVEQAERIMARDLSQAADIQGRMLPEKAPDVPGRRSGRLQHGLPHGGRRLLRFLHLPRWPRGARPGRRFGQGHARLADDDGAAGARAGAGRRAGQSGALHDAHQQGHLRQRAPATASSRSSSPSSTPPPANSPTPTRDTIRRSWCAPTATPKCWKAAARCWEFSPSRPTARCTPNWTTATCWCSTATA